MTDLMNVNEHEAKLKRLAADNFTGAKAALLDLLQIPSVESEAQNNAPFGTKVARAMQKTADLAAELGLNVQLTPYYLTVDLGETDGSNAVGVLSHIDVVPIGTDWQHNPCGEVVGDKIYGRGALDDKGPTVAALFAMAALKQSGLPLSRPIRMIIGGNEESGSRCIARYKEEQPAPAFGFSPDANFPVIFAEKGIALSQATLHAAPQHLLAIHAGTVVNAVPALAEAQLSGLATADLAGLKDYGVSAEFLADGTVKITAHGKAAHGSMPEKGDNAIWRLLTALGTLPLGEAELNACRTVSALFGSDYHGLGSGIACRDEMSGELTLNFGTLDMQDGRWQLGLDMRYPVTADFAEIWRKLTETAAQNGIDIEIEEHKPPLYVPQDADPAAALLALYREYDPAAEALAIGGGTYCRAFENFVAFGPLRPTTCDLMHQADEYITEEDLRFLLEIYALALWRLAGKACQ